MDASSLAKYTISQQQTIEEAMALIEENNHRTVIIVNEENVVVGTLSDGDIRKIILGHRLMTTPIHKVMTTGFIALREDERERAQEFFKREHIFLIPIVDETGHLLDIETSY